MDKLLTEEEFRKISVYISDNLGLYFAEDRQQDLERGLAQAAKEAGFSDMKSYVVFLLNSPAQKEHINLLAVYLTIGETYFFRESKTFEILRNEIFKEFLSSKEKLRIWSAGCCTGEEPYSIAIMVDEMFPEGRKKDITILGTDINTEFLKRAQKGTYGQWSFRNVPEHIINKFFTKAENKKYQIIPRIQKMVRFSYLNLMEDRYPSILNETNAMDIIFCRNTLLYFNKEGAERVLEGFYNSLIEGGWFIPGMSELSHLKHPKLKSVHFTESILFRKESSSTEAEKEKEEKPTVRSNSSRIIEELTGKIKRLATTRHAEKRAKEKETKKKEAKETGVPLNEGYTFATAQELYNKGDYGNSARQFEYLIKTGMLLKSERDESYIMISKCYANLGDTGMAKEWCHKGLEINKLNPVLYLLMSNLLQEENNLSEATEAVRKVIFLNPDHVMAHFTLANIYRRRGNSRDGIRHLRIALNVLGKYRESEIVEGSEGLSAGMLKNIIQTFITENSQK